MIYLDIGIIVITILLWLFIRNFIRFIKISSILNIITGYIIIIMGILVKEFIKNKVNFINTTAINNIVFRMISDKALIMLLVGAIEFIIYIVIIIYKKYYNKELRININ